MVEQRIDDGNTVPIRVEWQGDYADMWEPQENLPKELISSYLLRRLWKDLERYPSRIRSQESNEQGEFLKKH